MRIVQIIDSLEPGGAERMAVNYANALSEKIDFSALVTTRKEGAIKDQIDDKVSYLFLNKKKSVDIAAVFRLRTFVLKHKITWVHAHSSSFFIAGLLKLMLPQIKIIWHDHYGISQDLSARNSILLKLTSRLFTGSIAVNSSLKNWAESYLLHATVVCFPNFINLPHEEGEKIKLEGNDGKRIVCIANLRPQKNHKLLLKVAIFCKNKFPDWTFHLFGKDFNDAYSYEIKSYIEKWKLQNTVFFYGTTDNVSAVLNQCDIAVLTSLSEGLPLAILEYGVNSLPVIATNVGDISKIITSEDEGFIVESDNANEFNIALEKLITDKTYRDQISLGLNKKIQLDYNENNIIDKYVTWLLSLSKFAPRI